MKDIFVQINKASTLISRLYVFIFFTSIALQAQTKNNKSIQSIWNATTIINYGGYKILVDPMLYPKGGLISVARKQNSPLVDLPIPISEIVESLDLVLVTHNHFDSDTVKNEFFIPPFLFLLYSAIYNVKVDNNNWN